MRNALSFKIATIYIAALFVSLVALQAKAQENKTLYPTMAPLEQYLIADRNDEIALARSAAPDSISHDATVMVLGKRGYETAVQGKNGFVCFVWRSWAAGPEDPDFWNPKLRAPACLNPPAVRSYLPNTIKRTDLVLAGSSKEKMFSALAAAFDKKELPPPEPNSMCYMMSKQAYLSTRGGNWHPHLMIFTPLTEPAMWGALLPGSPILAFTEKEAHVSIFLIPVGQWSDGTTAPPYLTSPASSAKR
jgi:hypothetical protein